MTVVACGAQVFTHQQLQARIERWVAARGLTAAEVPSWFCQGVADGSGSVGAPADCQSTPVAELAATTGATATDPSALSKQVQVMHLWNSV